jgi:hypothetical protein
MTYVIFAAPQGIIALQVRNHPETIPQLKGCKTTYRLMLTESIIAGSYWWSKSTEFGCGNNGGANLRLTLVANSLQDSWTITLALMAI